jgi:hypothetical protein
MASRLHRFGCVGMALFLAVQAFSLFASPQAATDDFLSGQQRELAINPEGLVFKIGFKDNKNRFQQGEIIRVELSFSSIIKNKYQLNNAIYDRGGRLRLDSYYVDPSEGAVDPLKYQYDYYDGPRMGGGVFSTPALDANPYTIVRDLNEYLRFDKPGKYRLYVVSNRICGEKDWPFDGPAATSNIIEFTIIPTDLEWAAKQFQSAQDALYSGKRGDTIRVISFLGTEESTRYIVQHFENQYEFMLGLIGSPIPSVVVREMEKGLEDSDCAVSTLYLYILSNCAYALKHAPDALYLNVQDAVKVSPSQEEEVLKKHVGHTAVLKVYAKQLATAIPNKKGSAKSASLLTMLDVTRRWQNETRSSLPAELLKRISPDIAQLFFDFTPLEQESLLTRQWAWIKQRQDIMPLLERYYQIRLHEKYKGDPFGGSVALDASESDSKQESMQIMVHATATGIGLQRIFELDPARGRELILKEIANPSGRVPFKVLALLPDKTLPELDDSFVTAMEKPQQGNPEILSVQVQLLNRYGTAAILPRIKAAFYKKDWPASCDVQAPVISYFFRVDPAYATEALDQALLPSSRCCKSLLGSLARLHYGPEIETLAIRRLDDPDPEVVADSVRTLGEYGSAQAEAPLWKRFEKWHEEWKDKADQLQRTDFPVQKVVTGQITTAKSGRPPELETARRLESYFADALAQAPGWFADAEKLKRIQSLCLTKHEIDMVGYHISLAEAPKKRLTLDSRLAYAAQYNLNIYEPLDKMKAKLAQFPKGTIFLLQPGLFLEEDEDQEEALLKELKPFLEEHGMILERQPLP